MSAASTVAAVLPEARRTRARRVASIDIFRGLAMMVMIFVNDLAEVHGLPWWTYHAHAQQDVMTYVDVVFPFFFSLSACRYLWPLNDGLSRIHRSSPSGAILDFAH
jgi:hypothetical protein